MPVAGKECIDIPAVPGFLLRDQNSADGATVRFPVLAYGTITPALQAREQTQYQKSMESDHSDAFIEAHEEHPSIISEKSLPPQDSSMAD
jgi:hypothetical protein